jgi:predicted permease
MRTLLQDLRYGLRVTAKSPGFALVAVATLAIGIAANTAVFSWIDHVLLRPLPGVSAPAQLAAFETRAPNGEYVTTSYADYRDYRDHLTLLDGLAMAQPRALSVGEQDHAVRVWGELVSGNYFAVLGVKPLAGRTFSPDEYGDKQGGYPVAVIGEGLWKRLFQADPDSIGKTIRVNRQLLTVVGVVPAEFRGTIPGLAFEIWVPAMMGPQLNLMPDWMMADRQTRAFLAVARLKSGTGLERANAELASVAGRLASMYPKTNKGISAEVMPVAKGHFGAQSFLTAPLRILMAVCGLVLLIVCANLANLLLARSALRQKEFGLRMALGAGRGRVMRQVLTESLVLVAMGAIVSAPLVAWIDQGAGYIIPAGTLPVAISSEFDFAILGFAIALCAVACVVSGLLPALHTAHVDLNRLLTEGGRSGSAGVRSQKLRGALVSAEVALALVTVIGAALFARSFQLARQIDPGFDPKQVLVTHLYLSTSGYKVPERKLFCRRLRDRLESQPGVVRAAYADVLPLGFDPGPWEDLEIQGYVPGPGENMKIARDMVAPGYFDLMKIPLLEGRDFTDRDDATVPPVMIVNQTFARRFLGGGNPVGRKVYGWSKWFTVVGMVRDAKYRTPDEAARPYFYVPFQQVYREDLAIAFLLRTRGDPREAMALVRREIRAIDPNVGVYDAMPLEEFIGASLLPQKLGAIFLSGLGLVAVLLAAVGLYSVMAYAIAQRRAEIGIRMALGARPADVLALVVRQGMAMTAVGLAAGIAAALAVTRAAAGLLVNMSATDPLIFAAATLLLAVIAAAASYVPAWRATRIDPSTALRS